MAKKGLDHDAVAQLVGHRFQRPDLLREALTHPSFHEGGQRLEPDYERLEFLGDRVLGLIIASHLFQADADRREGEMALHFNSVVRRESLAEAARGLGLGRHILLGRSEAASGGAERDSVLSDVFEAVIGALYLDGGLEVARNFVEKQLTAKLQEKSAGDKDAKTRLQERAQGEGKAIPAYHLVERTGPDHAPQFTIRVEVEGMDGAEGTGRSKREAEQQAAAELLERWRDE